MVLTFCTAHDGAKEEHRERHKSGLSSTKHTIMSCPYAHSYVDTTKPGHSALRRERSENSKTGNKKCKKKRNKPNRSRWCNSLKRIFTACFNPNSAAVAAHDDEDDELFWATFYKAYGALCTPVIVGEIEKKTLDVKVTYANNAALDLTGYEPGQMSSSNPDGLVGRSVTELMPKAISEAHPGYVASWLARRGFATQKYTSQFTSTASTVENDGDDTSECSSVAAGMKEVEGISRRVEIITKDGQVMNADAALSFFAAKGMKKVVGITSFKQAEKLKVVSLGHMVFNLQYTPAASDTAYYVVVQPPEHFSEFAVHAKWKISVVSEGYELTEDDAAIIRGLIRKEVFHHISKISCGSELDITFVENDRTSLSEATMESITFALMSSINDSKSRKNMQLSVSCGVQKERGNINPIESFYKQ